MPVVYIKNFIEAANATIMPPEPAVSQIPLISLAKYPVPWQAVFARSLMDETARSQPRVQWELQPSRANDNHN